METVLYYDDGQWKLGKVTNHATPTSETIILCLYTCTGPALNHDNKEAAPEPAEPEPAEHEPIWCPWGDEGTDTLTTSWEPDPARAATEELARLRGTKSTHVSADAPPLRLSLKRKSRKNNRPLNRTARTMTTPSVPTRMDLKTQAYVDWKPRLRLCQRITES